jgi:RND family efflux transporter MFP subunit
LVLGGRINKVNVEEGSRVKAGDVLIELDHRVPQAKYDRAKAKADFAEKEFQRMQQLFKQGTVTPQNVDNARSNYDSAKADLNEAEVALENTFLKSPFDGVVIQKVAEVGNILEAGQTALAVADARSRLDFSEYRRNVGGISEDRSACAYLRG